MDDNTHNYEKLPHKHDHAKQTEALPATPMKDTAVTAWTTPRPTTIKVNHVHCKRQTLQPETRPQRSETTKERIPSKRCDNKQQRCKISQKRSAVNAQTIKTKELAQNRQPKMDDVIKIGNPIIAEQQKAQCEYCGASKKRNAERGDNHRDSAPSAGSERN